mmetsp:Transcript_4408/g.9939  ORF Transcript_4408/g.9939 Transcript_4408/m.9939 type:complete len:83 (+) Transcript_4408:186-434(+)
MHFFHIHSYFLNFHSHLAGNFEVQHFSQYLTSHSASSSHFLQFSHSAMKRSGFRPIGCLEGFLKFMFDALSNRDFSASISEN